MLPRSCCCPLTEVPDWGGLQDPCPRMQPRGDALTFPADGAASLCSALQGTKGRWALCCCLCSPRRCGLLSVPGPCWSSPGPAAPKQGCGPVVPCLPVLLYQSACGAAPHPPATPSPPSWPVLDGPRGPRAVPAAPAVPPGCVPPSSLPGEEGGADPELSELGPPQGCCPPPAPSPLCEAQCSRWVRAGNKTTRVCEPSVSGRGRGGGGECDVWEWEGPALATPPSRHVSSPSAASVPPSRGRGRSDGGGMDEEGGYGQCGGAPGVTGGGGGEGPGPAARHRGSGGRGRWSAGRGGVRAWDRRGLRGCRGRVVAGGAGRRCGAAGGDKAAPPGAGCAVRLRVRCGRNRGSADVRALMPPLGTPPGSSETGRCRSGAASALLRGSARVVPGVGERL